MTTKLQVAVPLREALVSRSGGRREGSRLLPYLFIGPAVLYLLVFQAYPLYQQMMLSFTRTGLLNPDEQTPVGLANYRVLLSGADFQHTLYVTAVYTFVCVVGSLVLGLLVALLLNQAFRGRSVARALITVPWAAPPVAVALIFTWIYNAQFGLLNHVAGTNQRWVDDASLAMPSILIATIWQIFPFTAVVILAALQAVPFEAKEAGVMDGADRLSAFRAVDWPVIRPTVILLTLFITIWSLRRFDLIWLMTQGGPVGATNTLVIDLYRRAFIFRELGEAAAVGMVGLVLAVAVTIVYFVATRRIDRAGAEQ